MSTFVLVHGICHTGSCWDRTRVDLSAAGHRVIAVDLALDNLEGDAAIVAMTLDSIYEEVVLVGHSYGGLVISRAAAGRTDISHLVYVAAVMIGAQEVFATKAAEFPAVPLTELAKISETGVITLDPEAASALHSL